MKNCRKRVDGGCRGILHEGARAGATSSPFEPLREIRAYDSAEDELDASGLQTIMVYNFVTLHHLKALGSILRVGNVKPNAHPWPA